MAGQGGTASNVFGPYGRIMPATPPLKGSFPLDFRQECHLEMLKYMCCLKEGGNQNSSCRENARDYFQCRMDKGLMAREEWNRLGYGDLQQPAEAGRGGDEPKKKPSTSPTIMRTREVWE